MKKKTIVAMLVLSISISYMAKAQENDLEEKSVQITLVSPIGTNGMQSGKYVNELSLNIIAGYNGGLDGLELGGFANLLKQDAEGFQGAGFANIVMGKMEGAQVAGFANLVRKKGEGAQLSGFANVNGGKFEGLQGAGFANVAPDGSEVVQIGGFGNMSTGKVSGLQIGGFMNLANDIDGGQVGGFINLTDEINGAQVSGFLNIADKVEGLQLGVFNICDSIDGIPIGFLSLVRNGYRGFEFWGSDALHMNLAYKIGVRKFYNIFATGAHFTSGFKWAFGYGLGTQLMIGDETVMNIEAISFEVIDNLRYWTFTSLNQLKINFGIEYQENKSFFVGPTYNVLVTDLYQPGGISNEIAPYAFYNRSHNGINLKMWIGINAGVRF